MLAIKSGKIKQTTMSIASHFTFTTGMGILGITVAVMVYLSPLPTFIRIYKKQSTEEFQSLPYLVSLLSSMLWLYYALVNGNDIFLMSINVVGCAIQAIYIAIYFAYATKQAKIWTAKLVSVILVAFFTIFGVIQFMKISSPQRIKVLGVICVIFSISVFIAPLSIMVKVVKTRSVRFMPFPLSFFLTLNALIWFFYGLLRKDGFIWLPNVVGFVFGLLQMAIYGVCKYSFSNKQDKTLEDQDKLTNVGQITDGEKELVKDCGPLEGEKSMQDHIKALVTDSQV